MRTIAAILLGGLLLSLPAAQAQSQPADRSFYRVEFTITDGAGSSEATTRHFTILTDTEDRGSLRTGSRIPYLTRRQKEASEDAPQYQYADVGVNITCSLRKIEEKVALNAEIDVTTLDLPDQGEASILPAPTNGSIRAAFSAILDPGTPSTIASIDDPVTQRKFAIEATVSRLK